MIKYLFLFESDRLVKILIVFLTFFMEKLQFILIKQIKDELIQIPSISIIKEVIRNRNKIRISLELLIDRNTWIIGEREVKVEVINRNKRFDNGHLENWTSAILDIYCIANPLGFHHYDCSSRCEVNEVDFFDNFLG